MPIVRMAVDWGDGGDPYVMSGWFKNRKEKCGEKSCNHDPNIVCGKDADCGSGNLCQAKVHFGNSPSACEEGYYQFTHIYECPGKATSKVPACAGTVTANCWDSSKSACVFTPKVQVLDNWGWCNGTCNTNGVIGECWDDPAELEKTPPTPEKQSCSIENKSTKDKHWTPFSSIIELTP